MIALIKTIQTIGQVTVFFQNTIFAESVFSPAYEGVPSVVFGTLRRGVLILVAVFAFVSMLTAVFFIHSIVVNEYALSRVSANIRAEENLLSTVLVRHAESASSEIILRAIEASPEANLVSIEAIKYIRSDAILQANALLQVR
ncbi:MAG: hypothetical protein AAB362_01735 [Patescibacteria group bacterium]